MRSAVATKVCTMPPDQLSTITADAVTLYRQGLSLLLAGQATEAIPLLSGALEIDARFAVANAALAVAHAEARTGDQADWRACIERARRAGNLSRRERQHVAVVALALEGRMTRASALGREHLHEFPGEAVVAHVLTARGVDLSDLPTRHVSE